LPHYHQGYQANPHQFTSRENDGTGLYFYRARYYSPTFQRFIAQDPLDFLGGDPNLYGYVRNQPTDLRDPRGRDLFTGIAGGVIGGVFGGFGTYLSNPCASWGQIAAGAATGAALGGLTGLIEPGAILGSAIAAGGDLLGQAIQGGPINVNEVLIAGAAGLAGAGFSSPFSGTEDEGLKVTGEIIGDTGGGALGLLLGGVDGGGGGSSSSCGCSK
jgi:RHS repeat-associated protein